jgi:hypothetical protein
MGRNHDFVTGDPLAACRQAPYLVAGANLGGAVMTRKPILMAAVLAVGLAGCANMNSTQQRMLSGGAIGAGAGAVVGALTGGLSVPAGALIGAGVGAGTGFIIDQSSKH